MSPVRAVTPQVPALGGGLQFYRDLDFHDAANDDLVTGDPYDPEWPDKPLRLKPTRGSNGRRLRGSSQVVASPMHESADRTTGRHGRSALSPSSPAAAPTAANRESERRAQAESEPQTWRGSRNGGNAPGFTPSSASPLRAEGGPVSPGSAPSPAGAAASPTNAC